MSYGRYALVLLVGYNSLACGLLKVANRRLAPSVEQCQVVAAKNDQYGRDAADYAVRIPGIAEDLQFVDGSRFYPPKAGETGFLAGRLRSAADPELQFSLSLTVWGLYAAPEGMPVRELDPAAYSENGGPVDVTRWSYFQVQSGSSLEGVGAKYAGQRITIEPAALQFGEGANNRNAKLGMAGQVAGKLAPITSSASGGTAIEGTTLSVIGLKLAFECRKVKQRRDIPAGGSGDDDDDWDDDDWD